MSEETQQNLEYVKPWREYLPTHRISFNFIKHDLPTQFSILELITLHV